MVLNNTPLQQPIEQIDAQNETQQLKNKKKWLSFLILVLTIVPSLFIIFFLFQSPVVSNFTQAINRNNSSQQNSVQNYQKALEENRKKAKLVQNSSAIEKGKEDSLLKPRDYYLILDQDKSVEFNSFIIVKISSEGKNEEKLMNITANDKVRITYYLPIMYPRLSPNEKYILFDTNKFVNLDERKIQQFSSSLQESRCSLWSLDSKGVACIEGSLVGNTVRYEINTYSTANEKFEILNESTIITESSEEKQQNLLQSFLSFAPKVIGLKDDFFIFGYTGYDGFLHLASLNVKTKQFKKFYTKQVGRLNLDFFNSKQYMQYSQKTNSVVYLLPNFNYSNKKYDYKLIIVNVETGNEKEIWGRSNNLSDGGNTFISFDHGKVAFETGDDKDQTLRHYYLVDLIDNKMVEIIPSKTLQDGTKLIPQSLLGFTNDGSGILIAAYTWKAIDHLDYTSSLGGPNYEFGKYILAVNQHGESKKLYGHRQQAGYPPGKEIKDFQTQLLPLMPKILQTTDNYIVVQ